MNKKIKIRIVSIFFGLWLLFQSWVVWHTKGFEEVLVWFVLLTIFILSITYREATTTKTKSREDEDE